MPPFHTVLVVVPDRELRRSIEFALEAEGFGIESHARLSSALPFDTPRDTVCAVVDENAIAGLNGKGERLDRISGPVILLVDRLRTVPQTSGIKVLTKPLLGRLLVDTVVDVIGHGATDPHPT